MVYQAQIYEAVPSLWERGTSIYILFKERRSCGGDKIMATLTEWSTFIDTHKNFAMALIFVFAGIYMSVVPGIKDGIANQWIGSAMTVAGVYIGHRYEASKNKKPSA